MYFINNKFFFFGNLPNLYTGYTNLYTDMFQSIIIRYSQTVIVSHLGKLQTCELTHYYTHSGKIQIQCELYDTLHNFIYTFTQNSLRPQNIVFYIQNISTQRA